MSILKKLINAGKMSLYRTNNNVFLRSSNLKPFSSDLYRKQVSENDVDITIPQTQDCSILEEPSQLPDLSHVMSELRPSFTFSYFADKCVAIQELIKLGVDFHKIERKRNLPSYLLELDFEKDMKPYISFLHIHGVPSDKLGRFFTVNPFLFMENLSDLDVRINYLKSKKFNNDMISKIITDCPQWLSLTTKRVDSILGFYQSRLTLSGDEIRQAVCKYPKIITISKYHIAKDLFLFQDVNGFSKEQTKQLFLKQPFIWCAQIEAIQSRIDVMVVDMGVPLSMIVAEPCGLVTRASRMKERYLYLKELGKAQFDPTKPNYVSMLDICRGDDASFCDKVAKTSVETFNLFLKSL